MSRSPLLPIVAVSVLFASSAHGQAAWSASGATGPSARFRAAIGADPARGALVLFGGGPDAMTPLNDTWEWFGGAWVQQNTANAPSARQGSNFARDRGTGQMVLFGGYNGLGTDGDTWTYNGVDWSQVATVGVPPQTRMFSSMCWDGNNGALMMFGGATLNGGFTILDDCWRKNGNTWQPVANGPALRCSHDMVWDERLERVVMFGGWTGLAELGDTWEWDGSAWSQRTPANAPPARQEFVMAFDGARGRTILYGGRNGTTIYDDTWEWDGNDWRQIATAPRPTARTFPSMAYHAATRRVVMFGGLDSASAPLGDTQQLATPSPATSLAVGGGCTTSLGTTSLAVDGFAEAWVGDVYRVVIDNVPTTAPSLAGFGFSTTMWGAIPLPLLLDPFGAIGCLVWSEAPIAFPTVRQGTTTSFAFTVLNQPSTLGQTFALQGFVLDPGANAFGLATTNSVLSTIGLR